MMEAIEEERLTPPQQAHRKFNEASARVDALRRLIDCAWRPMPSALRY